MRRRIGLVGLIVMGMLMGVPLGGLRLGVSDVCGQDPAVAENGAGGQGGHG